MLVGGSGKRLFGAAPKSHPEVEGEDSKGSKVLQVELQWTQRDTNTCSPPAGGRALDLDGAGKEPHDVGCVVLEHPPVRAGETAERNEHELVAPHAPGGDATAPDERERAEEPVDRHDGIPAGRSGNDEECAFES